MNFTPSEHQAAGHDGCLAAGPVFAKLTTQQEIDFYAEAQLRAQDDVDLGSDLSHWMPTYMGTLKKGAIASVEESIVADDATSIAALMAKTSPDDKQYIVLENLYHGFLKPSILDIKMGAVLVDDTVTEEKRERLAKVSASTTSGSLHFRVCGMKRFRGDVDTKPEREVFPGLNDTVEVEKSDEGNYLKYNKFYGRKLTEETAAKGILEFFEALLVHTKLLLTRFYQRLQLFYNCLLDTEVRVVSGSLYFIYETDPKAWADLDEDSYFDRDAIIGEALDGEDEDEDEAQESPLSSLHFIDFAHSKFVDGQGPDENVLVGVEKLIDIFARLVEQAN